MPVTKVSDSSASVSQAVRHLLRSQVVVGIPDGSADRQPSPGEPTPPSNAVIAYVQEFGAPDKNIPARPFLIPGTESVKDTVAIRMAKAGEMALSGNPSDVERGLMAVGLVAADAVRRQITDGSFTPLAERTIKARAARGQKGAKQYLKLRGQGTSEDILQGAGLIKPLIDTGQLRRSITYVVRSK